LIETALLVIDVQVGILDQYPAYNKDQVLANISDLITEARAARVQVIYVRHDGGKGDPLEAKTAGWQIHQRVAPADGEPIVDKRSCSSFYDTPLQAMLDKSGISHLIVTCRCQFLAVKWHARVLLRSPEVRLHSSLSEEPPRGRARSPARRA